MLLQLMPLLLLQDGMFQFAHLSFLRLDYLQKLLVLCLERLHRCRTGLVCAFLRGIFTLQRPRILEDVGLGLFGLPASFLFAG